MRGERWKECEEIRFNGRCASLRLGQYVALAAMGLNDRHSSVRASGRSARIDASRYAPPLVLAYDCGRRNNERLYQAEIYSERAVVDDVGQRCWVEREQVTQERRGTNVASPLLGAMIDGLLGHQVGGGSSGRDRGHQTVTRVVQPCTQPRRDARPTC